jgi:yecA family protein
LLSEPDQVAHPIDHENAEALASMLAILARASSSDEDALLVDTLDGYLTALACGPVYGYPLQAMDALFGDHWAAALDEQEATEAFMEALHTRWTEIGEALEPGRLAAEPEQMQLMPLITEFDEAAKADLITQGVMRFEEMDALPAAGVLWVQGFLRAVQDQSHDWHRFDHASPLGHELDAMLMAIAVVAMPPGQQFNAYVAEAYESEDVVDQEVLLDDALFCVQDLKLFWQRPEARKNLS